MSFTESESGLIDRYRGTVVDAWFGVDAQYNPDVTLLWLKIQTDESTIEGRTPENFDGTIIEKLSCGKGWVSYDQGKTIEDPSDPDRKKFHQNSLYFAFMQTVAELGAGPYLASLAGRGRKSTEADVWIGFDMTWGPKTFKYGKEIGDRTRTFPEVFHGVVEGAGGGNSAPPAQAPAAQAQPQTAPAPEQAPLPAQEAPAQAAPAGDDVLATLDPPMVEALRNAKNETSSHSEFVDKCLTLTGVADNGNLIMALADEAKVYARL